MAISKKNGNGAGDPNVEMAAAAPEKPPEPAPPRIQWNTAELKNSYCNVFNASSTREEVVLNFGLNPSWDRSLGDLQVQLQHRIVLSPFAAKRLAKTLSQLMQEYESRFGPLS